MIIDSRISNSAALIGKGRLSALYLKNNEQFLWFILVPQVNECQEIFQLKSTDQGILMDEICQLSQIISKITNPDKMNVGALGNIVSQLHVHVVARFKTDPVWPHSIWQAGVADTPYNSVKLNEMVDNWRHILIDHNYLSSSC